MMMVVNMRTPFLLAIAWSLLSTPTPTLGFGQVFPSDPARSVANAYIGSGFMDHNAAAYVEGLGNGLHDGIDVAMPAGATVYSPHTDGAPCTIVGRSEFPIGYVALAQGIYPNYHTQGSQYPVVRVAHLDQPIVVSPFYDNNTVLGTVSTGVDHVHLSIQRFDDPDYLSGSGTEYVNPVFYAFEDAQWMAPGPLNRPQPWWKLYRCKSARPYVGAGSRTICASASPKSST